MKKIRIGGQALIEGIMMRVENNIAMAARKPNGKIVTKKRKVNSLTTRSKIAKLPIIRGIIIFFEILIIGWKALNWSAQQQEVKSETQLSNTALTITFIFSLILGLTFFALLPYLLTNLAGLREQATPLIFNLVDGIIKLTILVGYLLLIGSLKDVRRVFQYHGAEHMAVHCYEKGRKLTIDNIRKFSPIHKRCGTSFLLLVIFIGIILFSFIPLIVNAIYDITGMFWLFRFFILFVSRLLMLPIVAGFSYEILKLSAKFKDSLFLRILIFPGLLAQKITTKQPDNDQIEVAIKSLKTALR